MRVAATVTPTAAMPEGAGWRSATGGDEMEAPRALLRLMAWLSQPFRPAHLPTPTVWSGRWNPVTYTTKPVLPLG